MKSKKLRGILIALSIIALVLIGTYFICSAVSLPTDGTAGDGISWTYDVKTKTLTLSGEGDVTNQESLAKLSGTAETLIVERGITSLCNRNFENFKNLKEVRLSDTVAVVGEFSFRNCQSLEKISLSKGTVKLLAYSFSACKSLKSVVIPSTVNFIGKKVFYNCTSLKNVTVCGRPKTVSTGAFGYFKGDEGEFTAVEGFTLKGVPGTKTEKYAFSNNLKFTGLKKAEISLSKDKYICNGKNKKPSVTVSSGKTVIAPADYTVTYPSGSGNVGVHSVVVSLESTKYYLTNDTATFTVVPSKVNGLVLSSTKAGRINVSYGASTGAEYYQVWVSQTVNGKYSVMKTTNQLTCTLKNLTGGATYFIKIRAFKKVDGIRYFSDYSSIGSVVVKAAYKTTSKGYKIEVKDGITYVDGILIANKTYTLPSSYAPGDLTSDTKAAFKEMQTAASKDGVNLYIISGYRSYSTQSNLYNRYVARDGKAAADTYSARPGHSEHQSGYAMDLNSVANAFANTKEGKWIAANCWKYGFILRYPKGKESVTGYIYEPWHVRYVGKDLAKKVYESGLCLEEYFGITSSYD